MPTACCRRTVPATDPVEELLSAVLGGTDLSVAPGVARLNPRAGSSDALRTPFARRADAVQIVGRIRAPNRVAVRGLGFGAEGGAGAISYV